MRSAAGVLLAAVVAQLAAGAPEPYATIGPGSMSGPAQPASRDPLVAYRWDADAVTSKLQIFSVKPVSVAAAPTAAATGLQTLVDAAYGSGNAVLSASLSIMIDFGVEHGAWLELQLAAGLPAGWNVTLGISEYNAHKAASVGPPMAAPKVYDAGTTLRLETNSLLFDGLRYAWMDARCTVSTCAPITVTGVRAVAQILPMNYTGSISTGDLELDRIWYTGAYSVRVNLQPGFFGSELLSRGDRAPPFQGDAHVAQAAGMAAFGSPTMWALVRTMLNFTDSAARPVHDSNIVRCHAHAWCCV